MARLARVVVPGHPHHITQRGNRRGQTFFCDEDYEEYIALMAQWCSRLGSEFFRKSVDFVSAEKLPRHERTGRPLGSENFVVKLEKILDRTLRPKKPGRKHKKGT